MQDVMLQTAGAVDVPECLAHEVFYLMLLFGAFGPYSAGIFIPIIKISYNISRFWKIFWNIFFSILSKILYSYFFITYITDTKC